MTLTHVLRPLREKWSTPPSRRLAAGPLFLLACLVLIPACGPGDAPPPPVPAGDPPLETIVPPEGLPGWSLQLEASLGAEEHKTLRFKVHAKTSFWNLLFPSNGVLPGMQVRVSGVRRVLIDPATSRYARITGARQDFLGLGEARPMISWHERAGDGTARLRFTVLHPDGFSSWHELTLVPDPTGQGPVLRDLAELITAPLPVRLPSALLDLSLASWTWRHARDGRKGFSRFRILRAEPMPLLREDLIQDFPKYSLRPLNDLLPGAQTSDGRTGAWLQSEGPIGILFVDDRVLGFLPPKRPVYLGPHNTARVAVVPLLGAPPRWTGTVRGPDVWTIDD